VSTVETEPVLQVVEDPPPEAEPTVEELQARIEELETNLVTAGRTMIEFRAKVRTEAMAMAEQHNLCTVVENTLRKVGIDIERVQVEVVSTIERRARYQVPKELWDAVGDEGFLRWTVTKSIPRGHTARDFRAVRPQGTADVPVGEQTARLATAPLQQANVDVPPGYLAAYGSEDSRVMHLIHLNGQPMPEENQHGHYNARGTAVCGATTWSHWQPRSSRGEGRICARCRRAVVG